MRRSRNGTPFPRGTGDLRLLPFPGGKAFAFTIIDDTDGLTLEAARPIYDYLTDLGLRTTKTVWVNRPKVVSAKACDLGDTLDRPAYADYIRHLRSVGFEIALHNVSSGPNTREETIAGLERFRQVFGEYPAINVHHEKSPENMHFRFAQAGEHLPPPFRSTPLRRIHHLLRGRDSNVAYRNGCRGEDRTSEYFWGDICKARIRYVRTNVFFQDLDTFKCNPEAPYVRPETPYVNHWFDSSNGQDALHFNRILSSRNVERLRAARGYSILYTHFGRGFVHDAGRGPEFNQKSRDLLRGVAAFKDSWFVPVSTLLDRLRAFQNILFYPVSSGAAIVNRNAFAIDSVTLEAAPRSDFIDLRGNRFGSGENGWIVIPSIPAGATTLLIAAAAGGAAMCWYEDRKPALLYDAEKCARYAMDTVKSALSSALGSRELPAPSREPKAQPGRTFIKEVR